MKLSHQSTLPPFAIYSHPTWHLVSPPLKLHYSREYATVICHNFQPLQGTKQFTDMGGWKFFNLSNRKIINVKTGLLCNKLVVPRCHSSLLPWHITRPCSPHPNTTSNEATTPDGTGMQPCHLLALDRAGNCLPTAKPATAVTFVIHLLYGRHASDSSCYSGSVKINAAKLCPTSWPAATPHVNRISATRSERITNSLGVSTFRTEGPTLTSCPKSSKISSSSFVIINLPAAICVDIDRIVVDGKTDTSRWPVQSGVYFLFQFTTYYTIVTQITPPAYWLRARFLWRTIEVMLIVDDEL